ncbi:dUTP diphosphatase [Gemmobacter denitrificans]|uniref:dUTP diphosphatase n=1 Tax=Gemmobacter denitrificans TaxID=3123040 RepID=A0ABU8BUR6_9RHOB
MLGSWTPQVEIRVLDLRLLDWGLPRHQTDMAAAVDLFACIDAPLAVAPQAPALLVPSGLALLMGDPHMAAMILPRSGLGHKKGLVMGNSVGLIDADYMAEVQISVWNRNPDGAEIMIEPGERIAQMIFVPVLRPAFTVVDQFSRETARGLGGFGSTGQ